MIAIVEEGGGIVVAVAVGVVVAVDEGFFAILRGGLVVVVVRGGRGVVVVTGVVEVMEDIGGTLGVKEEAVPTDTVATPLLFPSEGVPLRASMRFFCLLVAAAGVCL
jgi:hypothetical protein